MSDVKDIVDICALIEHAFRLLGFEPPAAILLKDHEQGMRALHELHQKAYLTIPFEGDRGGRPVENPDGSIWMEAQIYGIRIRWPAKKLALPAGGFRFV